MQTLREKTAQEQAQQMKAARRTLNQNSKRIAELDALFQRLYEDSVAGRISDERFIRMSGTYEDEQAALQAESARLEAELAAERQAADELKRFMNVVRSYTRVDELTPTVLNEFIDKIVVHAPDKSSGKRTQKVEIFYRFIGLFDLPDGDETAALLQDKKRQKNKRLGTAKTA